MSRRRRNAYSSYYGSRGGSRGLADWFGLLALLCMLVCSVILLVRVLGAGVLTTALTVVLILVLVLLNGLHAFVQLPVRRNVAGKLICAVVALVLSAAAVENFPLPLSLGLGMLGARLAHWYFRRDAYESLTAALTDYSVGGFLLAGAFAGVFLAALILAALRRGRHLGAMLDAMSMAGAGAIALGRLSCLTYSSNRKRRINLPGSGQIPLSGEGSAKR